MLSSSKIGEKAALILSDAGYVTWTVATLAKWINLACRDLVVMKPTALTQRVSMLLSAGTRQTLAGATFKNPSDGQAATLTALQLLDVSRNMGADGITAGRAITVIERRALDVMLPGWHGSTAGSEIRHVMPDPDDPKTFYNYPPVAASPALYAEMLASRLPVNTLSDAASSLGTDDIDAGLDESYESALVDGTLYRAFSGDSETADPQRSAMHRQAMAAALGVKLQTEKVYKPRRREEE